MPADLTPVVAAIVEYGNDRADEQKNQDDATLALVTADLEFTRTELAGVQVQLEAVEDAFEAYKASHPDVTPDPEPEPEPEPEPVPTGRGPVLGMSSPKEVWATRKREVQATGGRLQARRIFLNDGLGSSLALVREAIAEGLYPIVSYKLGTYSWGDVASGRADADLRTLATSLKALGARVFVCLHHEPGKISLGPTKGEGGTAVEFAAMNHRALDILKAGAPNVDYGVCMNGWMWSNAGRSFTDAELEVWLPKALRAKLDVVAADDYSPQGGEESVVKTRNRAAWARRVGSVKALGVGEFNSFEAAALANVVNFARTEPLFRDGFLCVWNSTGGSYLPLTETGLLDDFQALLKGWPTP